MWILFAVISSLSLGFYDVFKKMALDKDNVFTVLFLNTVFCTLFMSPALICTLNDMTGNFVKPVSHLYLFIKALVVTSSWLLGYYAIKHLPLTIQGSINAMRPVLILVGAIIIFDERPNLLQWTGIVLGFISLVWIGFIIARAIRSRTTAGCGPGCSRWCCGPWQCLGGVLLWHLCTQGKRHQAQGRRSGFARHWRGVYDCRFALVTRQPITLQTLIT